MNETESNQQWHQLGDVLPGTTRKQGRQAGKQGGHTLPLVWAPAGPPPLNPIKPASWNMIQSQAPNDNQHQSTGNQQRGGVGWWVGFITCTRLLHRVTNNREQINWTGTDTEPGPPVKHQHPKRKDQATHVNFYSTKSSTVKSRWDLFKWDILKNKKSNQISIQSKTQSLAVILTELLVLRSSSVLLKG